MYHQINPTELFRERHLVLLQEAENRRLVRRLRVARRSGQEKVMERLRRTALLFAAVVMVLIISATAALAEIRVGTDNAETIVGTNSADQINGKGGNDSLRGKAANDTYHFGEGLGDDTLTETAFVKVGEKQLPGGTDTLSFSHVSDVVGVVMIPQWVAENQGFNLVSTDEGDSIDLGTSRVENVVGGSGGDAITGGPAKNTCKGGPGATTSSPTSAATTAAPLTTPICRISPPATTPTRALRPALVTTR